MNRFDRLLVKVRGLIPVLGVIVLLGARAPGVHHHSETLEHRSCAVCSAAHAPAIMPDAAPTPGTPRTFEAGALAAPECPVPVSIRAASPPRAPPLG